MRKFILPVAALLVLSACNGRKYDNEEQAVCAAAEEYYDYLINGKVDRYMAALHDVDSLPQEYRDQLRDMFLQYIGNEQQEHDGLKSAKATRCEFSADSLAANAFLDITFGDNTSEQIALPLVRVGKEWKLK